ncbi:MAG TPA: hypothetical protein VH142_02320, partial [Polyangiaceae bacterium]|nr:hypothetical protein [Polyangiaceae bacterium]
MRFVHIAPRAALDRVARHGIRQGFLFRYQRGTRHRPVAVIFEPRSLIWPGDLHVALKPHVGLAFLENAARHRGQITIVERESMLSEVRAGHVPDIQ